MDKIMTDLTGIALAIVGVALLTVTVKNASGTSSVISSASGGFAQVLTAAMGGGSGGYGTLGG